MSASSPVRCASTASLRLPCCLLIGWADHCHSGSIADRWPRVNCRSEEHTSELQSLMRISYAVFCLKKKKTSIKTRTNTRSNVQTQDHHNPTSKYNNILHQR